MVITYFGGRCQRRTARAGEFRCVRVCAGVFVTRSFCCLLLFVIELWATWDISMWKQNLMRLSMRLGMAVFSNSVK